MGQFASKEKGAGGDDSSSASASSAFGGGGGGGFGGASTRGLPPTNSDTYTYSDTGSRAEFGGNQLNSNGGGGNASSVGANTNSFPANLDSFSLDGEVPKEKKNERRVESSRASSHAAVNPVLNLNQSPNQNPDVIAKQVKAKKEESARSLRKFTVTDEGLRSVEEEAIMQRKRYLGQLHQGVVHHTQEVGESGFREGGKSEMSEKSGIEEGQTTDHDDGPQQLLKLLSSSNSSSSSSSSASSSSAAESPNKKQLSRQLRQLESLLPDERLVTCVFRWEDGGREVFITGTFNDWKTKIRMHRTTGSGFQYIQRLPKGKHAYKFIVDGEWRFATDQPTVADTEHNINNVVDLTDFEPQFTGEDTSMGTGPGGKGKRQLNEILDDTHETLLNGELFGAYVPDVDDYTKEPPALPPQMRQVVLNANPPNARYPAKMARPYHVTLDHLYCTAVRDGLMVLGMTQRFRERFVTTVYYAPVVPTAFPRGQ